MTIVSATIATAGGSAHARGRRGGGDGGNVHAADIVIDGIIGYGVMTSMREVRRCS